MRVSSSNFDPFPFWEAGMQMVSLGVRVGVGVGVGVGVR